MDIVPSLPSLNQNPEPHSTGKMGFILPYMALQLISNIPLAQHIPGQRKLIDHKRLLALQVRNKQGMDTHTAHRVKVHDRQGLTVDMGMNSSNTPGRNLVHPVDITGV